MDNTIQALQALYVALGGSLTDTYSGICDGAAVKNYVIIPDMINAIAALVTAGGLQALPAVTADDNGDVLMVISGAWAKGTIEANG